MEDRLKKFMNRVLTIEPQYIDIFGNGVPGMAGRSAATSGAANAGADTVNQLRHDTVAFAKACARSRTSQQELQKLAEPVEGGLTVCVTLGVLAEKEAQDLIDELYSLQADR